MKKKVLITGTSKGLGYELAKKFEKKGIVSSDILEKGITI